MSFLDTYQPHYGWKPSNQNTVQMPSLRAREQELLARAVLASVDLRHFVECAEDVGATAGQSPIFDQGPSSSCVANAGSMAVRSKLFVLCEDVEGALAKEEARAKVDAPSRLCGYQGARRVDRSERLDGGTHLQSWLDFGHRVGIPRENDPLLEIAWDPERVLENVCDGPAVTHAAYDSRLVKAAHRLDDGRSRTELKAAVQAILSNLDFVIFGIPLCVDFGRLTPGQVYTRQKPLIGHHAMCVVGYDARGVLVVNSWSRGFCDRGYAWISWDYFLDAAWDIHVVDVVAPFLR
jgi:hypothetical protein